LHGFPALGLPGAGVWNEQRDAPILLKLVEEADAPFVIYVVVEPDRGGEAMLDWLRRSRIAEHVRLVRLPAKDVSALLPGGARQLL
jgi:hypothetical protein